MHSQLVRPPMMGAPVLVGQRTNATSDHHSMDDSSRPVSAGSDGLGAITEEAETVFPGLIAENGTGVGTGGGPAANPMHVARKKLEEQFAILKQSVSMHCDQALATLRQIEMDNSPLTAENLKKIPAENVKNSGGADSDSHNSQASQSSSLRNAAGGCTVRTSETTLQLSRHPRSERKVRPEAVAEGTTDVRPSHLNPSYIPASKRHVSIISRKNTELISAPSQASNVSNVSNVSNEAFKKWPTDATHSEDDHHGEGGRRWSSKFWGWKNEHMKKSMAPADRGTTYHKPVLPDAEDMKEAVRKAMRVPEYNVATYYKDHGYFQKIARSQAFEYTTLTIIAINALWIGIECDHNKKAVISEAPVGFQVGEHLFCTYFLIEWIIRFNSFDAKRNCIRDAWFVFDSSLCFMMVFETWIITIIFAMSSGGSENSGMLANSSILRLLRLLRLTRMARVAKLLRAMPEIMILIKGMTVAMRSVFFTLVLLVIIMYIFAVAFVQATQGQAVGASYFPTVPDAMKTLLLNGTFLENIPDCYYMCTKDNELFGFLLLLYVLIASLTVMNMLVGVLVEVVSVVATVEKEGLVTSFVKNYLQNIWLNAGLDLNGDDMINKDEFMMLLQNPDATKLLDSVGVDVVGLVDFADYIFRGDDLPFLDFVEVVLMLRGNLTAKVKDIVDLRKYMSVELEQRAYERDTALIDMINRTNQLCERMLKASDSLRDTANLNRKPSQAS